ncbi:MAG TPA: AsmA-like C-terminal region-containing protein, partial [Chthoniobacterales bacterium]|nr:AsmA-like C-terminal region-containing protein [Chthoniobacterales bacterium]
RNFRGHVYFPPERISVSQAEGNFCGIQISATGELIKRGDYKPSEEPSQEDWQRRLSILRQIVTNLQKFSAPGPLPSLQVKFNGDLAQIENAQVEATLQAKQLRRGPYELRDLFAVAEWRDQTFSVTRCEWQDDLGNFAGRGSWSRQRNTAAFQARSTLDLKKLGDAIGFGERLADVGFSSPPEIEIRGDADFGERQPQLKVIGHARVERLTYKSVPFSDCGFEFSWDGDRTLVRDIHLKQDRGELHAEILDAPNDFRLNIESSINPVIVRAFVSPEMNHFLGDWEFPQDASLRLAIRGQDRHAQNWQGDGNIALGRTRFRGVWMKSASAKVHFGNGAVDYQDLRVTRDEGVATGSFTYDFANHEVRVANIKSSLRPVDVAVWVDPDLPRTVAPYRFRQSPAITANGVYQFRGGKNTRLDIAVDGQKGMDYTFLGKVLPFDRINAKLVFTNDRLQIVDLAGALFSGQVRGSADISLAHNDPHYHASISVNKIDFPRLTDLYYNYKTSQGNLSGVYNFDGFGSDARKMHGTGKVQVTDGDVFAIPVFGPLSGILGHIMPGTGYSIARTAAADFTIKDGVIHTEDFGVAGTLFGMVGRGDIYFLDDKLDFDLRIDPKGPTVMLAPVYKLFEYKGEGSLKNPDWHPKRF